jgi:hypothetical protein
MSLLDFNEAQLVKALEQLPKEGRMAFACACAERLLPTYKLFSSHIIGRDDTLVMRSILDLLQKDLAGELASEEDLDKKLQLCMSLLPDEKDGEWVPERLAVEGALMATAYSLRCSKNGDPREAVWSARCAYEALEYFIVRSEDIRLNAIVAKSLVLSRPVVQTELARQQRDVDELIAHSVSTNQVLERARAEGETFLHNC